MREPTMTTMGDRAIADYTAFACYLAINPINPGGVAEWLKAPVLKTRCKDSHRNRQRMHRPSNLWWRGTMAI